VHRAGLMLFAVIVLVLVPAAPASAHTVSGVGATDFTSRVDSIVPAEPGLQVRFIENATRIELTNSSAVEVTVLGYSGEPYLRVGPGGVFQNVNSPATYLNKTRQGGVVPARLQGTAPLPAPVWQSVASGPTARWHDHRTHWRLPLLPPGVRANPSLAQPVLAWQIGLVRGGQPVTVNGTVLWVPSPSPWAWVGLAVVLAVVVALAGRVRWWGPALAGALALLVGADAVHAVGVGLDYAGGLPRQLVLIFGTSYYSIVAWILGLLGARLLLRRNIDGLFLAVFSALVMTVFGGFTDFRVLDRSEAPFAFPVTLERGLVSLTLGVGLGVIVGSILALRANSVREGEPSTV
jgi:hypothetical protein